MMVEIPGLLSALECDVLADVARESGATRALEVGHYHGRSTAVLLQALPDDCSLVTVDHHGGDYWTQETSVDRFRNNVAPYVNGRRFVTIAADMESALLELDPGFDFVFYDADHHLAAVEQFWSVGRGLLKPRDCILCFDDADWKEQATLIGLAEEAGFESIKPFGFARGKGDKDNPKTYTLEVMRR